MKYISLILMMLFFITSCEYSYDYSYQVTNNSDDQISVYVKTFRLDSTFIIKKDSTKVLFTSNHGIEGSKGPYFEDVKIELDEFSVTKKDNSISTKDYLKNDAWTFTIEPYFIGLYSAIVTNDEFNN